MPERVYSRKYLNNVVAFHVLYKSCLIRCYYNYKVINETWKSIMKLKKNNDKINCCRRSGKYKFDVISFNIYFRNLLPYTKRIRFKKEMVRFNQANTNQQKSDFTFLYVNRYSSILDKTEWFELKTFAISIFFVLRRVPNTRFL